MQNTQNENYGKYEPNLWLKVIFSITQSVPNIWILKRLVFLIRKISLLCAQSPFDVTRYNLKLRLYPHKNLCEKRILFTPQFFDPIERKILEENIPSDAIFLDIGANIGAYTLFVSTLVDNSARLLAYEPQPVVFERLLYNLSLNSTSMVKALACAIADKNGEMTLFMNSQNSGEASVVLVKHNNSEDIETFTVPCKTLYEICKEENLTRIDAIKLDVEGAEDLILVPFFKDAEDSLLPKLIILENARSRWSNDLLKTIDNKNYTLIAETRMNLVYKLQFNA